MLSRKSFSGRAQKYLKMMTYILKKTLHLIFLPNIIKFHIGKILFLASKLVPFSPYGPINYNNLLNKDPGHSAWMNMLGHRPIFHLRQSCFLSIAYP